MRKIITYSVFFMLFSMFSGPVLAGKVEVCEEIKDDPVYKGLYGLCNAYWNAEEEDREDILRNFNKKAGPEGPTMPGIDDPVLDPVGAPEPQTLACPCWPNAEIDLGVDGLECQVQETFAIAVYDGGAIQYAIGGLGTAYSCEYYNFMTGAIDGNVNLTPEELDVCAQDLLQRIADDAFLFECK